ncbi:MAG: S-formylglutathione hydrolase [Pseudomonadota bacterium]
MKTLNDSLCFEGRQTTHEHASSACQCSMRFSMFIPSSASLQTSPVLIFLSGLTCTEENVTVKSGFQRVAAELGLIVVAPDTSPRGEDVPDVESEYDMGKGAGFYLDATEEPWSRHYNMESYITRELPDLLVSELGMGTDRIGISGHSMGGHGALTLHLKNPDLFKTVSAFSPIVAPTQVPWGQKAFTQYLGTDQSTWKPYDATELVKQQASSAHILVDQGQSDQFLNEQLRPELFEEACSDAGQKLTLRRQEGYDHSYFFIASFMEDHLRWHAEHLADH